MRTISRIYDSYSDAADVVSRLEQASVPHDRISIIANQDAHGRHTSTSTTRESVTGTTSTSGTSTATGDHPLDPADRHDTDSSAGTKRGAVGGAVVGGAAALLAGIGAIAIPGIGPLVAAGWLVTTLTGAGAGAATGSLIGALTGAGVSHDEAETYNEGVRRGGTLVVARVEDADSARVESIMDKGSVSWRDRRASYGEGWTNQASDPNVATSTQSRRTI
jgi:hypothetical protein